MLVFLFLFSHLNIKIEIPCETGKEKETFDDLFLFFMRLNMCISYERWRIIKSMLA